MQSRAHGVDWVWQDLYIQKCVGGEDKEWEEKEKDTRVKTCGKGNMGGWVKGHK